jgi:biopolymer transport protein ExbD
VSVMDALQQANVAKVNLATEPIGEGSIKRSNL